MKGKIRFELLQWGPRQCCSPGLWACPQGEQGTPATWREPQVPLSETNLVSPTTGPFLSLGL